MTYIANVRTFKTTTRLGQLLSEIVYNRYHNKLLSQEESDEIPDRIREDIDRLCKQNKRLSPMEVYRNRYAVSGENYEFVEIYVSGKSRSYTDDTALRMSLYPAIDVDDEVLCKSR